MTRGPTGDRGSAVLEMVALLPLYMAFVMAVVVVGKYNNSAANIEAAARSAARTITLAEDPRSQAAVTAAEGQLDDIIGTTAFCSDVTLDPTYTGDPLMVTVTIECTVDLAQATFLGIPGSPKITATSTEIVDPFREGGGP